MLQMLKKMLEKFQKMLDNVQIRKSVLENVTFLKKMLEKVVSSSRMDCCKSQKTPQLC